MGERTRVTLDTDLRATARRALVADLPAGDQHTTRTALRGSDSSLYVSVGSSCNVCLESNPHRAAVWRYNRDSGGGRLYARGLRNAVGMAVNPVNQQIWVTDNGRDSLGDNRPPDTIDALHDGGNYGWPRCDAGSIIDPQFGAPGACVGVVQPLVRLPAHSAPLGLAFASTRQFPSAYHGLYVAYHGSWNRSVPTGYKVVFIPLDADGRAAGSPQDFVTGWLGTDGGIHGRPVGIAVGLDGALYVSDDSSGSIVCVAYAV